jgi:hypothetical protein
MKTPPLKNAVEISELHGKFDTLPHIKRANLEVGDSAKVCAIFGSGEGLTGERFWVVITKVDKATGCYQGFVNNCLVHSASHDVHFRDVILFEPRHIYDVVLRSEAAEMNRKRREEMSKPGFKNVSLKAHEENKTLQDTDDTSA